MGGTESRSSRRSKRRAASVPLRALSRMTVTNHRSRVTATITSPLLRKELQESLRTNKLAIYELEKSE